MNDSLSKRSLYPESGTTPPQSAYSGEDTSAISSPPASITSSLLARRTVNSIAPDAEGATLPVNRENLSSVDTIKQHFDDAKDNFTHQHAAKGSDVPPITPQVTAQAERLGVALHDGKVALNTISRATSPQEGQTTPSTEQVATATKVLRNSMRVMGVDPQSEPSPAKSALSKVLTEAKPHAGQPLPRPTNTIAPPPPTPPVNGPESRGKER
ncbi:MAG: hypothetical protein MK052_09910 [Alphaproteobacteria bacterium]|nr:hypothetical protein [Alphaproteobacteria bacterium]